MNLVFSSYLATFVSALLLARSQRYLPASLLIIPLFFCGYFLISVYVFDFGRIMPFSYFTDRLLPVYGFVSVLFCSHFLVIAGAFFLFDDENRNNLNIKSATDKFDFKIKNRSLGLVGFWVALLPSLFILLAVPLSQLWERDTFIFESDEARWMKFADLTFLFSVSVIPFIGSHILRFSALFLLVVSFLAVGSRSAVVAIFIFALIDLFLQKRNAIFVNISLLALGAWLLGVVLFLRYLNLGGLVNVFDIFTLNGVGASDVAYQILYGMNYILNLSFVLIGELLVTVVPKENWFFYSISPLPSSILGQSLQYDAENRFRANIPFSGFGYSIAFLGWFKYLLIVFGSSSLFILLRRKFSTRRDVYDFVLCYAFFSFPFLISLQYNLRTTCRLIYLFSAVYFFFSVFRRVKLRS